MRLSSGPRQESELASLLTSRLEEIGLKVNTDGAADKIGGNADNILAEVSPGHKKSILLAAHIDSIAGDAPEAALNNGEQLIRGEADRLGADDKAGISVILAILNSLSGRLPPGLGIVFTVAEELGLLGASVLPQKFIGMFDQALVLDGEAPVGTIFNQEPAAVFFGLSLNQSPLENKLTSRQKMLLRRIRHYWNKSDLCLVSHLISGPLPAWNFFQEEILVIGIKGEDIQEIEAQWKKKLKELMRYFGIRADNLTYSLLHTCSGFRLADNRPWLQKLETSLQHAGIKSEYSASSHISEAAKFHDYGVECVNIGLGLSGAHTPRENVNLNSLQQLTRALENFLLNF